MRVKTYDEGAFGFSWVIDEPMLRTSHALASGGRVWLVEPVDVAEALDRATALGEPAAVIQLLDRHNRDCAAVAMRLGVPHLRLPDAVPDSPFEIVRVLDVPRWHERALWWEEQGLLLVPETVGTGPVFRAGSEQAGIHPFLRAWPPGALRGRKPQHLLVGHGSGVHGAAAPEALEVAHARARRDIPRLLAKLPSMLRPR